MSNVNPYLSQVGGVLPRLLALFDDDSTSPTCGVGDRFYWAWKLIDFGNGTFQGAAHGLAQLMAADLLPGWLTSASALRRVGAMFQGAEILRRRDGSMEEAFPHERSFCVTSLVAFDLLSAVHLLREQLSKDVRSQYLDVVRPMIRFLHKADETHAFISNHLATAATALFKWHVLTGEGGEERGREILERILREQSREGWFREYEGADPGYQSLSTYYLADLHALRPDLELLEPLRNSIRFLWHFAHPDGSFGGHYGSRNTRFYCPAGVEALAGKIPEAAALADFMRDAVENHRTVTLDVLDEPNLVPMFNAYCQAAVLVEKTVKCQSAATSLVLPACRTARARTVFSEAGLIIDSAAQHYTIVSVHKGGVCYHFNKVTGRSIIDAGLVARAPNGTLFSTQACDPKNTLNIEGDTVIVTSRLAALHRQMPTAAKFLILRLMTFTLMRVSFVNSWIKKLLVKHLITGKKTASVMNRRTIRLGPDLTTTDVFEAAVNGFTRVAADRPIRAIHMASQGYWQRQDEQS